jgi:hypothetical protein
MCRRILLLAWLILLNIPGQTKPLAETPFLERTVTVVIKEERTDEALKKIALQGGFTFSYNPMIINTAKIVSFSFTNKTVREILNQLFANSIEYKERGRYVILTRSQPNKKQIGGYVTDEETGQRLKNVTIYDPVTLSSAVTDSYGYFELELDDPLANITLVVNKQNYADTLLVVPSDEIRLLKIPIKESKEKIKTFADSVGQKFKRFWRKKVLAQDINMLNVSDTLYRKAQFSVFPFIGTNHKLSGNVINDYSLNLYGGYSLGNKKFEMAGLFNINRGDVSGGQVAGWFNAAGGNVHGAQFAGLINATWGKSSGASFAGIINANWGASENFAMAGLANFVHGESRGVKFAGLANVSLSSQNGWHTAGLTNFSRKGVRGVQLSGFANVALDTVRGAQISGLYNVATRKVEGAQISGLVNYARKVKGVQIGLINVADSVKGVQLGFLSYAVNGYHTIELSADEVFYTNIAFRTGTRKFYNIFASGMNPGTLKEDETTWSFGYGFGTLPKITKWLYLNADLTSNQIVKGNIEAVNLLNKLYLGVDLRLAKKLSLTFGATLNARVSDLTYSNYPELFPDYKPKVFSQYIVDDKYLWQWWWGGKVGLRFF